MAYEDWEPTVQAVGAYVRARTKDDVGNELGTFTEDTRPNEAQVVELIDKAQSAVANAIGEDFDPKWNERARDLAALRAAMLVELTHFPEQVAAGRSPYPQLKELWDEEVIALSAAVAAGGDSEDQAGAMSPVAILGTGLSTGPPIPFADAAGDDNGLPDEARPVYIPSPGRATGWDSQW
jgi:hypothetical protein